MKGKRNSYYAFTLIELLAVIVILGILLGLAVGGYIGYLNQSRGKSYTIAENSFKDATMAAMENCMAGGNKNSAFCNNHAIPQNQFDYELVYLNELIAGDYIDPIKNPYNTEEFCDANNSYVYVSNRADMDVDMNYNLYYKICLVCGDKKSAFCDEDLDAPADFDTSCEVYYDENLTIPYDGEWTDQDLFIKFNASEGYTSGISRFNYKGEKESKWKSFSVKEPQGVLRFSESINDELLAQAYDDLNHAGSIAQCGSTAIRIDKTVIEDATLTGKRANGKAIPSGKWSDSHVTLTVTVNPRTCVSGYLYRWYKDGVLVQDWSESNTYVAKEDGTYKAEVTNIFKKQIVATNDFVVKIDSTAPVITVLQDPLNLKKEDYEFIDNITVTFGPSGGEYACDPKASRKTGSYDVTCTATSNSDLKTTVTFKVRHSYPATYVPKQCTGQNCYTCRSPHDCYSCDSWRNGTCCTYKCSDGRERQSIKSYIDPDSGEWAGRGDEYTKCENTSYDCSYYTCPEGGTVQGTMCVF